MFFVGVTSFSKSPPPVPTPTKSGQADKHVSHDKGSGKEKGEDHAQALVPPVDKGGSNLETQPQTQKASHGDDPSSIKDLSGYLITAFTGFLALLAYLQWHAMRKQAEYMRKGLRISVRAARASKHAADAAKRSADAAMSTEGALLIATPEFLSDLYGMKAENLPVNYIRVEITARNYGKSPASAANFFLKEKFLGIGAYSDEGGQ
jgi:hypothetical protein